MALNPEDSAEFFIPALAPVYRRFAQPLGWAVFRLAVGGVLVYEGWPKMLAPMSQIGFVEMAGFHPGWLFSPILAAMQLFGGILIMLGLFTRPAALANGVMLLLTLWFHVSHPFGHAFITPEGLQLIQQNAALYLTPQGRARLIPDGGVTFLDLVQSKAEYASLFWAGGALLIAAFGGWHFSLDRRFFKREF
jgi:putative oxidoreductase